MIKKAIIDAYVRIRTIDHTIPDDVLDFFKESALKVLEAPDLPTSEKELQEEGLWNSANIKPPYNRGVLVFLPDEDSHITSGMWDISNKWVLLDEYRTPECEVTHWMPLPTPPQQ